MANVNLCCSIEMEPKTLRGVQLFRAREVAADVAQKLEPKEASFLFIKGLESVGFNDEKEEKEREFLNSVECNPVANDPKSPIIEKPCQCSLINNNVSDSPGQVNLKEPLSAPF